METTIECRSNLSYAEFVADYLNPRRPVVIADAAKHWQAQRWTLDYLRENFGDRRVTTYEGSAFGSPKGQDSTMRDAIDAIKTSTPEKPARYIKTFSLHRIPEMMRDVLPVHEYLADNWLESPLLPHFAIDLFVGAPGATLPYIHHERIHHHGFTTLTFGQKLFTLYSPDQSPYMYPQDGLLRQKSRIADPETVDLDQYPLFANAVAAKRVLDPGQTLFIPAGWWHTSKILSASINVHHCFANSSNWNDMVSELKRRISEAGRWGAFIPFTYAPNCCTPVPAGLFLAQLITVGWLKGGAHLNRATRSKCLT